MIIDGQTKGLLGDNHEIEFTVSCSNPKPTVNYHLLPAGVILDGVETKFPLVCVFIGGSVRTNNGVKAIADFY